jgi:hypothetical protein
MGCGKIWFMFPQTKEENTRASPPYATGAIFSKVPSYTTPSHDSDATCS